MDSQHNRGGKWKLVGSNVVPCMNILAGGRCAPQGRAIDFGGPSSSRHRCLQRARFDCPIRKLVKNQQPNTPGAVMQKENSRFPFSLGRRLLAATMGPFVPQTGIARVFWNGLESRQHLYKTAGGRICKKRYSCRGKRPYNGPHRCLFYNKHSNQFLFFSPLPPSFLLPHQPPSSAMVSALLDDWPAVHLSSSSPAAGIQPPAGLQQKKPRHRHSPEQLAALNSLFDRNEHPPLEARAALAERLGMFV